MTMALRVISASMILKNTVQTGLVEGRQAEDHPGRARQFDHLLLGDDALGAEILVR